MDKLTTERLHQYQKSFDARDDHQGDFRVDDVRAMVAELLSLRTDAGDGELQAALRKIATLAAERDEAKSGNDFLRQEIEDWKEANRRAEAERDEARKEVQLQRGAWEAQTNREKDACQRAGITFGGCDTVHDLADAVETLTAELAALKSCPEMGEVEAIEDWLEGKEIEFGVVRRIKRLVEMVGRLSAALTEERNARVLAQKQRDEIILDLNTVDRVDYLGELRHMAAYTGSEPSDAIFAARRILAICGKEVG